MVQANQGCTSSLQLLPNQAQSFPEKHANGRCNRKSIFFAGHCKVETYDYLIIEDNAVSASIVEEIEYIRYIEPFLVALRYSIYRTVSHC